VADLYRVRWEVELSITLDTSVNRLDALDSARPCSLKTLRHASLMASTLAAILAHTHHLQTRPQQPGAPRMEAPLHPRRLALQLAVSCQSIAQAFDLQGGAAQRLWEKMAAILTHAGKDPNGRRRPSVLDQLRGWKRQPLARQATHSGEVSNGNSTVVICHAGTPVLPLDQVQYCDRDEGVCDGIADDRACSCGQRPCRGLPGSV